MTNVGWIWMRIQSFEARETEKKEPLVHGEQEP